MSINVQRNSLRKSTISIDKIQKSISGLREGLLNIRVSAANILKEQRKTNLFRKNVIRKDDEFFIKRRENVLRKQREDELESSSVTGVTKKQGNLFAQSTRGFLGRILDFLGVLLIGWALQNLPKFIAAFQKLFGMIKKVVEIMTGFVKVITTFLQGIGEGFGKLFGVISKIDFSDSTKLVGELFQKGSSQLDNLTRDFINGINGLANDKDIQDAGLQGFMMEESGVNNTGGDQGGFFQGITNMFGLGKKDDDEDEKVEDEGGEEGGEGIEGRANGGKFEKGQDILVGEEGPEIVRFNQGGEVIDNENTMNLIAGLQTLPDDEDIESVDGEKVIEEFGEKIDRLNDKDNPDETKSPQFKNNKMGNIDIPALANTDNTESENETKVEGNDKIVKNITPSRRQLKNLKGVKKSKTRTFIIKENVSGGQGGLQPSVNSGGNHMLAQKSRSDVSTLLRLQSGSTLKYT